MYAMNIQNDVIGLMLCENCKSKQVTDFIEYSLWSKYYTYIQVIEISVFHLYRKITFFTFLISYWFGLGFFNQFNILWLRVWILFPEWIDTSICVLLFQ